MSQYARQLRMALAQSLMPQQGTQNIRTPLEGIGRLGQIMASVLMQKHVMDDMDAGRARANQALIEMLSPVTQEQQITLSASPKQQQMANEMLVNSAANPDLAAATPDIIQPQTQTIRTQRPRTRQEMLGMALGNEDLAEFMPEIGSALVSQAFTPDKKETVTLPGGGVGIANLTQGSIDTLVEGQAPVILSDEETAALGFRPGTVVQRKPDGTTSVLQSPTKTTTKKAWNSKTGKLQFVTEEQIQSNPNLMPVDSSMSLEVQPDGTVRMITGGGQGGSLSNSTRTKQEDDIRVDATNLGELNTLITGLEGREDLFSLEGDVREFGLGLRERLGGFGDAVFGEMTDDQKAFLQGRSQDLSGLYRYAASIVNQLYGAALSEGEAARASQFIPEPGDSYSVVMGKLKDARAEARRGFARQVLARKNGIDDWSSISLAPGGELDQMVANMTFTEALPAFRQNATLNATLQRYGMLSSAAAFERGFQMLQDDDPALADQVRQVLMGVGERVQTELGLR